MAGEKRVAVVTGGAGAIGLAAASELMRQGWAVQVVDRSGEALEEACRRLSEAGNGGGQWLATEADVTEAAHVGRAVAECLAAHGRIDALVNVAGGAGPVRAASIEELEATTWQHVMDLNVLSTFLCCRAVVPVMRRQRHGRIIVLSSIIAHGEKGPPTTVSARLPYATAKAALLGFTTQLAKDVAADGITVNALMPGLILGEPGTRIAGRFAALPEAEQARMLAGYPIGRPGRADEVASAIAFLCSDAAAFISGAALPVDGAYL